MAHMLPRSCVFILEIGAARVGFVIRIRSSLSGKHTIQACSGPHGRTIAMITIIDHYKHLATPSPMQGVGRCETQLRRFNLE